ncbi:MAG: UpxY family transcription antiterminator [Myxococcota bacterium]
MSPDDITKWYALAVYTRQEKAAHEEIASLGVESFLPTRQTRKLWSDRIKQSSEPLFPGYLFVNLALTAELRVKIIRLKQVQDLVGRQKVTGAGSMAIHIPDQQIDSLRLLIGSQKVLEPTQKLIKGTQVRISQGPLKGAHGVIEQEPTGSRRIIVQLPLLGRGVKTELSADDVLSYEELGLN